MIDLTPEAQHLIARGDLGKSTAVYKPNTIRSTIVGLIFIVFGAIIIWVDISLTSASLFSPGLSLLRFLNPLSSFSPDLPDTFSIYPSAEAIFTILGIVFFLIGLLFVMLSLWAVLSAILNRHAQAVICANGVAFVTRKSAGTFRWEQVLTTFNKAAISISTRSSQYGGIRSSIGVRHTYTIYCHDGKQFVFDSSLGNVEDLAAEIEARVACWHATN